MFAVLAKRVHNTELRFKVYCNAMPSLDIEPVLHESHRWKGLRIGLFGGSFDPPHVGHAHVALSALNGLKLDYVWWLVSPQNPLKARKADSLAARLDLCKELAQHPRMVITDIETKLGTRITYDSVKAIKRCFPLTEFVWVGGMDIALDLHRWNHWESLLAEIPFVHIARPPANNLVKASPLRMRASQRHRIIQRPSAYPLEPNTSYWMLSRKMINISSSQIREQS